MKKLAALTLLLFLTMGTALADSTKDTPKDTPKEADAQPAKSAAATPAPAKSNAEIAAEMEQLRQAVQAQQEELQLLKEELAKRDRQIEEAREAAAAANSRAAEANAKATEAAATSAEVKTTTSELNSSVANLAASSAAASAASSAAAANPSAAVSTPAGQGNEEKGPLTIRYKGINITPGGFLAAETVNRQHAMSDDINTQFNAIPYNGVGLSKLSEMSLTARQSRISLLAESHVGDTKVTGYYETDFLGAGSTSNNRQSNSYVLRMRQLFARTDSASGWSIAGGQMWSLATETRTATVNRTEWIPNTIDPQYQVGFTWERQYGLRVSKTFDNKVTFAASMEAPQVTLTAHGNSTYTSASGSVNTNAFVFAPGAGGGLLNLSDATGYAVNKTPDFIVKLALDPGWGHYELFGVVSTFQDRVYPCAVVSIQAPTTSTATITDAFGNVYTGTYTSASLSGAGAVVNPACTNTTPSAAGAYNDSRVAGGVGASATVPLFAKKLDVGLKGFYDDGEGRYGSSQLPDTTLRPDGTLALVHGGHWLGRLEWHVTPKFDMYGYVGGEYAARTAYSDYVSVTGTSSSIPVTLTDALTGVSIIYPETTTVWKTSITGKGGYGYPGANNTACGTELPPTGTGTPASGSCTGDTRYISEGTLGFWHKVYQGEKGRVQWGIQYSYLYRNSWSGSGGTLPTGVPSISPHAVQNMVLTSFRYYLP